MARSYFGTDGIRGRVGEGNITPEFVLKLGWAAGRVLGKKPGAKVLIGKDTRISGYLFESALESGLVAAGMDVRLLGPMPTPGIAHLTRTLRAQAGIVISASHNPYHDNGIKFFSGDGCKLPDEIELEIERELDKPIRMVEPSHLGKVKRWDDAVGRYIEFCKGSIPWEMSFRGCRIALDCANGATYHATPKVLAELGAEVIPIGVEPDGLNINAGVGSTAPQALQDLVRETRADVGIALDGDGDRLIMVDEDGELVDGDEILFIIASHRLARGEFRGDVVGTVMSNMGLELALRELDINLVRTKVGDRYILERMENAGDVLGGEPSGHIICRDRTTTGDGTVSALQVLAAMHDSGRSLRALRQGFQRLPQTLVNVPLGDRAASDVMGEAGVVGAVKAVEAKLADEGRVLLRPSGTEPLIRVMVEGKNLPTVEACAEQIADVVRDLVA